MISLEEKTKIAYRQRDYKPIYGYEDTSHRAVTGSYIRHLSECGRRGKTMQGWTMFLPSKYFLNEFLKML